jgi:hypothetical protein
MFQAPSKDVLHQTCQEAFLYRDRRKIPDLVVSNLATQYGLKQDEAKKVSEIMTQYFIT